MPDRNVLVAFEITIDSANKHKAPFGVFDMVISGPILTWLSAFLIDWKGKVPKYFIFTTMPSLV